MKVRSLFNNRCKLGISYVIIPLIVLMGLAELGQSTKQGACGLCHVKQVRLWKSSVHKDIACTECHDKPYWLQLHHKRGYVIVRNSECERCHTDVAPSEPHMGQEGPHRGQINSKSLCIDCHSGVGHGQGTRGSSKLVSNPPQVNPESLKRTDIHLAVAVKPSHALQFAKISQKKLVKAVPEKKSCGSAVEITDSAVEPEPKPKEEPVKKPDQKTNKPESHNQADWLKIHGKTDDRSSCQTCHGKENTCSSCHGGVEMPHPDGWIMTHKEKGASFEQGSSCLKCHDKKNYCGRCHQDKVS